MASVSKLGLRPVRFAGDSKQQPQSAKITRSRRRMAGAVRIHQLAHGETDHIKFGDFILLSTEEEGEEGFLCAGGPGDNLVFVKTSKDAAAFEVLPKIDYQAEKAMRKMMEDIAQLGGEAGDKSENNNNLKELEEWRRKERQENEARFEKLSGRAMHYDQIFQLRHLTTGKFLAVLPKHSADLEPGAQKVVLEKEGSRRCWFTLKPRFQEEKSKVEQNDMVIIESQQFGLFIHQSSFTDEEGNYEVNLSSVITGWRISKHNLGRHKNVLHKNMHVRLHHQLGGFLVGNVKQHIEHDLAAVSGPSNPAAPSAVSTSPSPSAPTKTDRIYLKRRATGDVSSFNSIWQVESDAPIITWGTAVRLKLRSVNKYLCMVEDHCRSSALEGADSPAGPRAHSDQSEFYLALTDNRDSANTVFAFLPAQAQANQEITLGAFARLRSVAAGDCADTADGSAGAAAAAVGTAGRWVHCLLHDAMSTPSESTAYDAADSAGGGNVYSEVMGTARLFQEDAFSVQPVLASQVEMLEFAEQNMKIISDFLVKLKRRNTGTTNRNTAAGASTASTAGPLGEADWSSAQQALVELILWCSHSTNNDALTREGIPIKFHQKILGSRRYIDVLVGVVAAMSPEETVASKPAKLFARHVYRLLKQICRQNQKNGRFLAGHIAMLQDRMGLDVDIDVAVADVAMEMLANNTKLAGFVTADIIVRFIEQMRIPWISGGGDSSGGGIGESTGHTAKKGSMKNILELLSALCVCRGDPQPGMQNMIVQKLLLERPHLLIRKTYDPARGVAVATLPGSDEHYQPLKHLQFKPQFREFLETFEQQLLLLSRLCLGRNTTALEQVRRLVGVDEAYMCFACDIDILHQFRSAYGKLLLALYIDCYPQNDVTAIPNVWPMITQQASCSNAARSGSNYDVVSLNGMAVRVDDPHADNISQSSAAIDNLVAHSGLKLAAVADLKDSLVRMLDMSEHNDLFLTGVVMVRHLAAFGIFPAQDIRDLLLPKVIRILSTGGDACVPGLDAGGPSLAQSMRVMEDRDILFSEIRMEICRIFNVYFDLQLNEQLRRFASAFLIPADAARAVDTPTERELRRRMLERLMTSSVPASPENESDTALSKLLSEIHKPLIDTSQENALVRGLVALFQLQIHPLSAAVMKLLLRIQCKDAELKRAVARIQLLTSPDTIDHVYRPALIHTKKITDLACISLAKENVDEIEKTIAQLTALCYHREGIETGTDSAITQRAGPKVNHENQRLLRNMGVHKVILKTIFKYFQPTLSGDEGSSEKEKEKRDSNQRLRKIFQAGHRFLTAFCTQNPTNQRELFNSLDIILPHVGKRLRAEDTVNEIFVDNPSLCRRVTAAHLAPFVTLLVEVGPVPRILAFFETIVAPKGTTIRQNQVLVMDMLMARKSTLVVFQGNAGLDELIRLSNLEAKERVRTVYAYHVALIELLSTCAAGDNHETEIACQSLISLKFCLLLLSSKKLNDLLLLHAYMRFVDTVYLQPSASTRALYGSVAAAGTAGTATGGGTGGTAGAPVSPASPATAVSASTLANLQHDKHLWRVLRRCCEFIKDLALRAPNIRMSTAGSSLAMRVNVAGAVASAEDTVAKELEELVFDTMLPLIEHFYCNHFRKAKAEQRHIMASNVVVDILLQLLRTQYIVDTAKLAGMLSCIDAVSAHGFKGLASRAVFDENVNKASTRQERLARGLPTNSVSPLLPPAPAPPAAETDSADKSEEDDEISDADLKINYARAYRGILTHLAELSGTPTVHGSRPSIVAAAVNMVTRATKSTGAAMAPSTTSSTTAPLMSTRGSVSTAVGIGIGSGGSVENVIVRYFISVLKSTRAADDLKLRCLELLIMMVDCQPRPPHIVHRAWPAPVAGDAPALPTVTVTPPTAVAPLSTTATQPDRVLRRTSVLQKDDVSPVRRMAMARVASVYGLNRIAAVGPLPVVSTSATAAVASALDSRYRCVQERLVALGVLPAALLLLSSRDKRLVHESLRLLLRIVGLHTIRIGEAGQDAIDKIGNECHSNAIAPEQRDPPATSPVDSAPATSHLTNATTTTTTQPPNNAAIESETRRVVAEAIMEQFYNARDDGFFRSVRRILSRALAELRNVRAALGVQRKGGPVAATATANPMPLATGVEMRTVDEWRYQRRVAAWQRTQRTVHLLFRLFRLLCESQGGPSSAGAANMHRLQNYLRIQEDNLKSYDLVKDTVTYLTATEPLIAISGMLSPATTATCAGPLEPWSLTHLTMELLTTLRAFAIGCPDNKRALVMDYKVASPIYKLLRRPMDSPDWGDVDRRHQLDLKLRAVEFLITLADGLSDDRTVAGGLIKMLGDFRGLEECVELLHPGDNAEVVCHRLRGGDFDTTEKLALETFRLVKMLGELNSSLKRPSTALTSTLQRLNASFQGVIGSVEIVNANGRLERVYFPIHESERRLAISAPTQTPEQQSYWRILDGRFLNNRINWSSPTKKVTVFCTWIGDVLLRLEHKEYIEHLRWARPLVRCRLAWQMAVLVLTLLLNVLMIVFAGYSPGTYHFGNNAAIAITVRTLAALHLVFSVLHVTTVFIQEGSVLHWRHWFKWCQRRIRAYESKVVKLPDFMLKANAQRLSILSTTTEIRAYLKAIGLHKVHYVARSALQLLRNGYALFYIGYVVMSALGLLVSPFFFAYHLFEVVALSAMLRLVVKAFTFQSNIRRLLLMAFLVLVIAYVFAIFALLSNGDPLTNHDAGVYCETALQCLVSNLVYGITVNGGLAQFNAPLNWDDAQSPNSDGTRPVVALAIYDIVFYVVFGVLILNIVFAIIVDSFGQLRDDRSEIEQDRYLRCFICGNEADLFQKQPISKTKRNSNEMSTHGTANRFLAHTQNDHNPWNYLLFFSHLKRKLQLHQENELTDAEFWALEQIIAREYVTFFPLERAIVLEERESEEINVIREIEKIHKKLSLLSQQISKRIGEDRTTDPRSSGGATAGAGGVATTKLKRSSSMASISSSQ